MLTIQENPSQFFFSKSHIPLLKYHSRKNPSVIRTYQLWSLHFRQIRTSEYDPTEDTKINKDLQRCSEDDRICLDCSETCRQDIPTCWKLVSVLYSFSAVYFVSLLLALTGVKTVAVSYQFNTCSVANDPRPQMIPKPEMIPKLDRK